MLQGDRKSTRLNSSHGYISYAVFCLKKKKISQTSISSNSIHLSPSVHYSALTHIPSPVYLTNPRSCVRTTANPGDINTCQCTSMTLHLEFNPQRRWVTNAILTV